MYVCVYYVCMYACNVCMYRMSIRTTYTFTKSRSTEIAIAMETRPLMNTDTGSVLCILNRDILLQSVCKNP